MIYMHICYISWCVHVHTYACLLHCYSKILPEYQTVSKMSIRDITIAAILLKTSLSDGGLSLPFSLSNKLLCSSLM